jgi:hypothetical protein
MKKIFVRSPYFVEVDEASQIEVRLEIFLYYKDDSVPAEPNYVITEKVPSLTQNKISINVANYAKDFIKPIAPVTVTLPTEEDVNTWCYMQVVSYSDDVEIEDETFVCLNGYTNYSGGYNYSTTSDFFALSNTNIKRFLATNNSHYFNVWLGVDDFIYDNSDISDPFTTTSEGLWKLPLLGETTISDGVNDIKMFSETICEPIYTPVVCAFINRFGGWNYITFFKANTQGIDVKSKDFDLMPSGVNYNVLQGQKQRFNFQGTQKVKCNTGWVNENYSELIQDLLLSEVVLLDNKPAIVKSQSFEIKTHLKDKNINYEIDFEFNYGLINDVI